MSTRVCKCLVASPSDTQAERDVCDEVFHKINSTCGQHFDFRIESKKWENDASPSFGNDGQDVINSQLLNDYQLFIGIMWNKFGSPTPRAGSGTEEEFNHAFNRHKNKEDVEIKFYFNDAEISSSHLDLDEVKKVRLFKEKVGVLGGLYSTFKGTEDFKEKLEKHVTKYCLENYAISQDTKSIITEQGNLVLHKLNERLNNALSMFSDQTITWIDRIICKEDLLSDSLKENYENRLDIKSFIKNPDSSFIKAPPQFGLTSLAHYLVKQAWQEKLIWVYLEADKVKIRKLDKTINLELDFFNAPESNIDCIILDTWNRRKDSNIRLLKKLIEKFPQIPILIMETEEKTHLIFETENLTIGEGFCVYHLLALPKSKIREAVSCYNKELPIDDENIILNKIVSDLNVLNIHRTPMNCWTLLKVAENNFDKSPVNRTQMLEMVLFVLFNLNDLPTYKRTPDVKDCEHVLGYFCEKIIKEKSIEMAFSREQFLSTIQAFCKEQYIDMEVETLFDILFNNHILISYGAHFRFRASFWIYYFAAKQMLFNTAFCEYVLANKNYTSFPEVIEFYTGIERNRSDALKILNDELKKTCDEVEKKLGLDANFNPLHHLTWNPSEQTLSKMQKELRDDIKSSTLPDKIKDQHSDANYDHLKPYNQNFRNFMEEYSLVMLMQQVTASSRALRNSDYANIKIKKQLLEQILRCWEQISKVLFALAPILACQGSASFAGQNFKLSKGFKTEEASEKELFISILCCVPYNIIEFYRDDLFSNKLGPLLFDALENCKIDLIKHELILLFIAERPHKWNVHVENYIANIARDSFYLFNLVDQLQLRYKYSYSNGSNLGEMIRLIKKGVVKYKYKIDNPIGRNLKKYDEIVKSSLPTKVDN